MRGTSLVLVAALFGAAVSGPVSAQQAEPLGYGVEDAPNRYAFLSLVTCRHCVDLYATIRDGEVHGVPVLAREAAAQAHQALEDGRIRLDVYFVHQSRKDLWADLLVRCSADPLESHRRLQLAESHWRDVTFRHGEGFKRVEIPAARAVKVMRAILSPDLIAADAFDGCLQGEARAAEVVKVSRERYEEARSEAADATVNFPAAFIDGELNMGAVEILHAIADDLARR
ncbi:hypothetical protein [Rubrimonas cliftonensis]|uniref:Thioredoxin n=1 Tax=Rubrimonas cliftonensis TaxID=89524 RepID=A0A1H3X3X4_9RHOB|nr:hypothetical protein [Rubrimonas cliftonensis]SDZ94109.1 hypothetical protein SAMN05444370_102265 [Rubrimonas cliftonensis]